MTTSAQPVAGIERAAPRQHRSEVLYFALRNRKLVLGVADGTMKADGKVIYEAKDLKVGLFDNPRAL